MLSKTMRQNFKPYISLKCSGFFCNIEPISRSNNGILSPALLNDSLVFQSPTFTPNIHLANRATQDFITIFLKSILLKR